MSEGELFLLHGRLLVWLQTLEEALRSGMKPWIDECQQNVDRVVALLEELGVTVEVVLSTGGIVR